jgi:far upstream element-binding protein
MVPDPTVGLIIGRGGETIRDLQERSGCHINIVGENKSLNGLRPVNLIGSIEAAQKAKNLIMEIVDSDNRGETTSQSKKTFTVDGAMGGGRDHNNSGGGGMTGDKIHDSIRVPSEAVGMIIGKRGDTIREIQNQTGCKINVAQSSGEGEIEREIALIGSRDSIAHAKRSIEEKVDAVVSWSMMRRGTGSDANIHPSSDRRARAPVAEIGSEMAAVMAILKQALLQPRPHMLPRQSREDNRRPAPLLISMLHVC